MTTLVSRLPLYLEKFELLVGVLNKEGAKFTHEVTNRGSFKHVFISRKDRTHRGRGRIDLSLDMPLKMRPRFVVRARFDTPEAWLDVLYEVSDAHEGPQWRIEHSVPDPEKTHESLRDLVARYPEGGVEEQEALDAIASFTQYAIQPDGG